jgi:7-cyano-7-deazaguanine tRNA-ribosyltransferase
MQSYGHPALFSALKRLKDYADLLESGSPVSKPSGLFFYGAVDLARPEVARYRERLKWRYSPPEKAEVLVLLPQTRMKPFHRSREHARIIKEFDQRLGGKMAGIHLCTFAAPFGVVPLEIEEMYPLSQHEVALPLDNETLDYVAKQVEDYIERSHYQKVILLNNGETWGPKITSAVVRACKDKRTSSTVLNPSNPWNKPAMKSLLKAAQKAIGEKT